MMRTTASSESLIGVGKRWHGGFTLLELIVSISVVALLLSLVSTAVTATRKSARRMRCSSNLRQVGLAVQEYHSVHNALPCSDVLGFRFLSPLLDGRPGSWEFSGFPDPCLVEPCPEAGDWVRPRVYLCPSDPIVHRTRRSASYSFSSGLAIIFDGHHGVSDGVGFGDMDPAKIISLRDITDGTSNTACARGAFQNPMAIIAEMQNQACF